jgi:hypothetical protein
MSPRLRLLALVLLASLLSACGGGRSTPEAAAQGRLSPLASAVVDASLCDRAAASVHGPVRYRQQDGRCWRSTDLLSGQVEGHVEFHADGRADVSTDASNARRRALAAPSRLATPGELFDWAEVAYANFFPSKRGNLQLSTFTYRYYPESQNHAAVSEGKIYVQGPMSGGELQYVGTVEEFTCLALPALCGTAPTDCSPPTSWAQAGNVCQPAATQNARIASGGNFTYTDTSTPLVGTASYQCNNGSLTAVGTPTCAPEAAAACNTHAITWSQSGLQCSPNPGEPLQIPSGMTYTFSDSVQTNGKATYQCDNGTLTRVGNSTCQPAGPISCNPSDIQWSASGAFCSPDELPVQIADQTEYTFVDTSKVNTGSATFRCNAGTLSVINTPICAPPGVPDSFGGDGGSADGGASGDGTAGDGAPIVGGAVRVTDITGKIATATTDARGYYRVRLTGMVPPLLIRVAHPDGRVRHSVNFLPPRTNGYVFMGVTGLTDKVLSDLADSDTASSLVGAASMSPARLLRLATSFPSTLAALRNDTLVRPELVAAGINPDLFDPVNTPFRADGTGYDGVLDKLVFDTDSSGRTVVRSQTCTVTDVSWTVGGVTCSVGGVASSLTFVIAPGASLTVQDTTGTTRGSATFTCNRGLLSTATKAVCTAVE